MREMSVDGLLKGMASRSMDADQIERAEVREGLLIFSMTDKLPFKGYC